MLIFPIESVSQHFLFSIFVCIAIDLLMLNKELDIVAEFVLNKSLRNSAGSGGRQLYFKGREERPGQVERKRAHFVGQKSLAQAGKQ